MQHPSTVLILSYRRAMQKLIEQLCQHAGSATVTMEPGQATDRLVAEWGLAAFALVVLETDAPWEPQGHHPHMARRLLREWTALAPTLPFVLVGMQVQKHALLMIRADIVRFVAKPFEPHELSEAIQTFLPVQTRRPHRAAAALPQLTLSAPPNRSPAAAMRPNYEPFPHLA